MQHSITILSKSQFEICTTYDLDHRQSLKSHMIESYLFVPKTLQINSSTYPKYLFYRDIHTYARLSVEAVPLQQIAAEQNQCLQDLRQCIQRLAKTPGGAAAAVYEKRSRMFCWMLQGAIQDYFSESFSNVDVIQAQQRVKEYIDSIKQIVSRYRSLRDMLDEFEIENNSYQVFLLCDEYLSRLVQDRSYDLLEILRKCKLLTENGLKLSLMELIEGEINYRRNNNYSVFLNDNKDREKLVYRRSILARYMESILFLNTRLKKEGRLVQELMLSLAAGIAMIFATTASFFAHVKYGNWTTAFFVVLVVSYMFKDRIKAAAQVHFEKKGQKFFFDYKTDIYTESGRNIVGINRESFGFVGEKEVESAIMMARNRDRLADIDSDYVGENIILYKKRLGIYPERISQVFQGYKVDGISDVVRFNLTRFMRNMDDPRRTFFITEEGDYQKVHGRRVYHINLIAKYICGDDTQFRRFRIVVSRNGIKRIEERPCPQAD